MKTTLYNRPKASTTRPNRASPTGTSTIAPVLLTISPSLMSLSLPNTTTPTLSGSKFKAIPCYRNSRFTNSNVSLDQIHKPSSQRRIPPSHRLGYYSNRIHERYHHQCSIRDQFRLNRLWGRRPRCVLQVLRKFQHHGWLGWRESYEQRLKQLGKLPLRPIINKLFNLKLTKIQYSL